MRIILDLQACQTSGSRDRGMGRYSLSLARAIAEQSGSHEIWLVLNGQLPSTIPGIRKAFETLIPPDRIKTFQVPSNIAEVDPRNAWRGAAAEAIRQHFMVGLQPDIVHFSGLFEGLVDDAVTCVKPADGLTSATLYDLIPLIWKSQYLRSEHTRRWYFAKIAHLKSCHLLLAISESSRKEAVELLNIANDRIVTVPPAVNSCFRPLVISPMQEAALRARYGIKRPFIMYTGGIDFRKNIEVLIDAYAQLPINLRLVHQLAIVCSVHDNERQRLQQHAAKAGLNGNEVVLTGFVSDDDLIALYNLCRLFVFPSLHEGFGLPALEAMACGAAVIGSNTSSIPEVIGRRDALFDPSRPAFIAEAMTRVLSDEDLRESLRSNGPKRAGLFCWKQSAERALMAFETLKERTQFNSQRSASFHGRRLRLAYFSPVPPAKSGIASYSAELLPHLARYYDIDLMVDQDVPTDLPPNVNFPVRDIGWFKQNAYQYDRILYHFGNSHFHAHMFDLLAEYPGVVVLHDFFLGGVLHWLEVTGGAPGLFRRALYRSHGYPALLTYHESGLEAAILRFPANSSVLDVAVGVIVHSRFSLEAAQRAHPSAPLGNWCIIPHLRVLPNRQSDGIRERLALKSDDFVICSFGIIDPIKLNHQLIDAFLASGMADDPHCHLVFVGEAHDETYRTRLQDRIAGSSASNRIRITGYLDTEEYRSYLAAADLVVQLRRHSRGETSGTVLDAMAYGLPLIVSSCGPMIELRNDCVFKLPEVFSDADLIDALETLRKDYPLRRSMSERARHHIQTHHDPALIAQQYEKAIEAFSATSERARYVNLMSQLAERREGIEPSDDDLAAAAICINANSRHPHRRQLLFDVSPQMQGAPLPSSIRALFNRLLRDPDLNFRLEPVFWAGQKYKYAVRFTCNFLGFSPDFGVSDEPIDVRAGDHFLAASAPVDPGQKKELERFAASDVVIDVGIKNFPAHLFSAAIA